MRSKRGGGGDRKEKMARYLESKQYHYERQSKRHNNFMFEALGTEGIEVSLTEMRIPEGKADFRVEIFRSILHALFLICIWMRMSPGQL